MHEMGQCRYLTEDVNMRLLEEMEEISAPGSVLLTTMTPISYTQQQHPPSSLLSSWKWGFGDDYIEVGTQ
jgi:hypothetical protein